MFENVEENYQLVEGAYRKIKSYYYYNKNFILMRDKIALFEYNEIDVKFKRLSEYLKEPNTSSNNLYIQELISSIKYFILPKKFVSNNSVHESISSNLSFKEKNLNSINFFVDFPLELIIIDTIWTIYLGEIAYENNVLSNNIYGNLLYTKELYKKAKSETNTINNDTNKLFHLYFKKYSAWRNNAFKALEENYKKNCNSMLVSLDIQAYFYNVRFDFDIAKWFGDHHLIKEINFLTEVMNKSYLRFFELVKSLKSGLNEINSKGLPLPIGLFSSMLIGNVYLNEFDLDVLKLDGCIYYGRYVDDIIFCFDVEKTTDFELSSILRSVFKDERIFRITDENILFSKYSSLKIQNSKIKTLYIDSEESRALLDLYNKIKIIPSQMDVLPDNSIEYEDFEEYSYSIENFGSEFKIREIGNINFDAYKVSRFFSSLSRKQVSVNSFDNDKSIENQIKKISKYLDGNLAIENSSNWMNYMYFLVLSRRYKEVYKFYEKMMENIRIFDCSKLENSSYKNFKIIENKLKKTLSDHLEICFATAFCIDSEKINKNYRKINSKLKRLLSANLFDHSLISLPLINYSSTNEVKSFSRLDASNYHIEKTDLNISNFKIRFSPRFIHFEEIQLSIFLSSVRNNVVIENEKNFIEIYRIFLDVNKLEEIEPNIKIDSSVCFDYRLEKILVNTYQDTIFRQDELVVAVGNIKMNFYDVLDTIQDRWKTLTLSNKQNMRNLIREAYIESEKKVNILVMPELFLPIYWIKEVLDFTRKAQVVVSVGLQYITSKESKQVRNFVLTVVPFILESKFKYNYISIREKNDYSPIEIENIATKKHNCVNRNEAVYQIFSWRDIEISTFVCYELTDIQARAILKGNCDILNIPVYNQDTKYFSNIIDSSSRDLHSFVIQSNNSEYGDSRISGPYDRNFKDIIRIKGGENNHIMIGKIDFKKYVSYQAQYYEKLKSNVEFANKEGKLIISIKEKPDIKKLSARFNNKRSIAKFLKYKKFIQQADFKK